MTRLPISIVSTECVTIPSRPPITVQPLTSLIGRSAANEMSIPCAARVAARVDRAVADRDVAVTHVDAVELRARDGDAVEHDVAHVLDVDAVLAADDAHVADRHAARADDDAAAHDGAGLADQRLARVDHERPGVHAAAEMDGRRLNGVRGAGGAREEGDDDGRRGGPGAAELAAVLGVGEPQRAAARRARAPAPRARRRRRARPPARIGAWTPASRATPITAASSAAPSGSASQPGW